MTIPTPDHHSYDPPPAGHATWTERAAAVLFAILCLEVGLFLLIFPWTESYPANFLVTAWPRLTPWLVTDQARGALSGLGILNLFIGVSETLRLRRFAGR
jgi:hypothetical protein